MSKIAIIPARGGSKRIPRKNIKNFLGVPIIAYSIKAAIESKLFDEVMVSTDDIEIASIAKSLGAEVPFMRSHKNADDFATTIDVITEVISCYQSVGRDFDLGCCIYPSAPFTSALRIKEGMRVLNDLKYDCVFPVIQYGHPIQRALFIDEKHRMSMLQPEHLTTRSQDLKSSFHDAGQFYVFKVDALIEEQKLWTSNTGTLIISELSAQDIDNQDDWELAELKYQYLVKKGLI